MILSLLFFLISLLPDTVCTFPLEEPVLFIHILIMKCAGAAFLCTVQYHISNVSTSPLLYFSKTILIEDLL
jgi:hypothetical protein